MNIQADKTFLIVIIGFILYLLLLISIPFRRVYSNKQRGKLIIGIIQTKIELIRGILTGILSGILIFIPLIRNFDFLIQLVLILTGLIATELACRALTIYNNYGLYSKVLLVNGTCYKIDSIISLPILELPQEEQEKYDKSSLIISTKKQGLITIPFYNEEECKNITSALLDLLANR